MREQHHKLKRQVEQLKEADKQEEQIMKHNQQRDAKNKPTTANGNPRTQIRGNDQSNLKRPQTQGVGASLNRPNARPFTVNTQFGGMTALGLSKSIGGRGLSANYAALNPKLRKFENLIFRLKKILECEKKSLRQVKTLCSKEIEQKNFLEKILRQCVDDVKNEIQKKRTEGKVQYYQKTMNANGIGLKPKRTGGGGMGFDEKNLSKAEREKILEVLLSQERVLTLLYDKTFPPRPNSTTMAVGGARGLLGVSVKSNGAKSTKGGIDKESMRQFNYYGKTRLENLDEHDVQGLEREIDFIIRNSMRHTISRGATANYGDPSLVNIPNMGNNQDYSLPKKKSKTAGYTNPRIAKKRALRKKKLREESGYENQEIHQM